MSRTTVTVQECVRAGITPTYNAGTLTDGDAFTNDGKTMIQVLNTGGSTTLTIQTPGTVDGLAITDRTVVIPATTGNKYIGPFPTTQYNQSDGKVYLDWSQVTGITFAVVRVK
jgi:hypothetical protein